MRRVEVVLALLFPVVALPILAVTLLLAPLRAKAEGRAITQVREVAGFTSVQAGGPIDVEVQEGPAFRVEVTAEEGVAGELETRVDGESLRIGFREGAKVRGKASAKVSLPLLKGAAMGGSGSIRIVAKADATRDVALAVGGSGSIGWKGEAAKLTVSIGGSGSTKAEGAAKALVVQVGGSGNADARGLRAKEARVQVAGSGDVKLTVEGGPLTVQTVGSGDVEWWGTASETNVTQLGSGKVIARR